MALQEDHSQVEISLVSNGSPKQEQGRATSQEQETPDSSGSASRGSTADNDSLFSRCPTALPNCCRNRCLMVSIVCNAAFCIAIIALVVACFNRTEQPKPNVVQVEECPHDWIMYRKKCYYFSEDERDWNFSSEFCLSHNASLARIEDDEKAFCRLLNMKRSYWIGIEKGTGEMRKWLNGDIVKMKVTGTGECAFWIAQDINATASRCTSGHQWFCSKPVNKPR